MSKVSLKQTSNIPVAHSIEGVIQIVPCGRTTVFAAINSGDLKARKMGRRTIILDEDLRNWLGSLPQKKIAG